MDSQPQPRSVREWPACCWPRWCGPVIALLAGWVLETIVLHAIFTSAYPSANDFFPRWIGARALLLEGGNPYSAEVTRQIQLGMFGRLAGPGEDQVAFAYPLFAVLPVLPLIALPYAWAQAAWQALLLNLLVAGVFLTRPLTRRSAAGVLALAALATVLLYPAARAVILGQFAVLVVAALALALWAQRRGHDHLAGAALAIGLIKPQLVFLLLPGWLLWAARRGRWGVWLGCGAVAGALLLLTLPLHPTWPANFVQSLAAYQEYTRAEYGTEPVLAVLLGPLPDALAGPLFWLLGGAGVIAAAALWWRAARADDSLLVSVLFLPAYLATAVVTLVFPFDQPTTNQLILLPPLLLGLWRVPAPVAALGGATALVLPWVVFFATRENRLESAWQYLVFLIPASLAAYLANRRVKRASER